MDLSVVVITYNQEKFLGKTLLGILEQNFDQAWEIVVSDDCSSDATSELVSNLIRSHRNGDKIRYFRHVENIGAMNNFYFAMAQCKGTYISFCEGDDYWIDNDKLIQQFEQIRNNNKIGLVYTQAEIVHGLNEVPSKTVLGKKISNNSLLFSNVIPTLTAMFSRKILIDYLKEINPIKANWPMADYPLWLYISLNYEVVFIPKITARYRVLEESASHSKDKAKRYRFNVASFEIANLFAQKHLSQNSYYAFLEHRLLFLYLSSVKNNAEFENKYFEILNSVKKLSIKTRIYFLLLEKFQLKKLLNK